MKFLEEATGLDKVEIEQEIDRENFLGEQLVSAEIAGAVAAFRCTMGVGVWISAASPRSDGKKGFALCT